MTHLFLMVLAFLLVLLNAFFVAAEFGMVRLRQTRVAMLKKSHGLENRILSYVHTHLDAYLSACQLGITFASLGLGWVGEPAFAHLLEPVFHLIGIGSAETIKIISFFFAFSVISFLHIVVGELMPKSLAIRQSEMVSLWTAVPLYGFYWLMYPAIWLLNTCSNFFLKLTGLDKTHRSEHFYSTDEIKLVLSSSHLHGELTREEFDMLEHTLEFTDLRVTEVMRPYSEMVMLNISQSIEVLMKLMMENRYSRYPIYDPDKKEIIGIIHVKDLFSTIYQKGKIDNIRELIRPILKVSSRLPALDVLRKFREGMPHFALIYSKPENYVGFVTLDNLLHVLIGRIKDEFHKTKEDWIMNSDGTITAKGSCTLYSLEQALDRDIEIEDETLETLDNLILKKLGHAATINDEIQFDIFSVKIIEVGGAHVVKAVIIPKKYEFSD